MKKEKQKKEMLEEEKKVKIEKTDINNQECVYHKYLWYLILFSVIGLFVEIILCFIIGKMPNKEFGLILGPFCIIYGLGVATAVFLIFTNTFFTIGIPKVFEIALAISSLWL